MQQDNLIKFLEESFRKNRDLPAMTDYFTGTTFTYYTMALEVAKLHLLFDECGLKDDDKVALIGRNNPHWIIVYLAVITYGSVIVPIMQDFGSNDINHIVNHSGAKFLFLGEPFWDIIETDRAPKLKAVFSLSDFKCLHERDGERLTNFQRNILRHYNTKYPKGFLTKNIAYDAPVLSKVAMICYTSGTTGFSKGVMLTIGNLTSNVEYILSKKLYSRGSNLLGMLPMGHIYGLVFDLLAPLSAGTHITLLGGMPSVKVLTKAMQSVHPNIVCVVPNVLENIVRREIISRLKTGAVKFASMILGEQAIDPAARKMLMYIFGGEATHVIIGGASLNQEIEQYLRHIKFPFSVIYGMTECASLISFATPEEFVQGSCGRIVDRVEVTIDSPEPENISGEILVRGDNVMSGYYKDKPGTKNTIDHEEWLHTGDVGTMRSDGTLFIRGRMETRIELPDGNIIYPEEIESRLNVMNCVMESIIVRHNEKLVALVVPDYEQADSLGKGLSGIREVMAENMETLNSSLDEFCHVSDIVLYPVEFEKTPKMTIKRYIYTK